MIKGGSNTGDGIQVQDLLVFRSSLNLREVQALAGGQLLQASLDVYAPLATANLAENRAQSLSRVRVILDD